jgi:REP element-mobilizing transposase RayT
MARLLRLERAGAWYHITARGNERRVIYREERDRAHFLELIPEWLERFDCRLHAYVLMDNHYHLLLQTRQANLSRAMQWLNVSYTVWFNRRHQRVGHLLQGRFKAVVVEPETWALGLSRYIHLNPVRIGRLSLSKEQQRAQRQGAGVRASKELIAERVRELRQFRWSSYRAYGGYVQTPPWLEVGTVLRYGGGRPAERTRRYRAYVEEAVREGFAESPWEGLVGRLALGSRQFVQELTGASEPGAVQKQWAQRVRERPDFEEVVAAVEKVKGAAWEQFRDRHGDWGRDLVLYLGRQKTLLSLSELAAASGSSNAVAVSMAVKRFGQRLQSDKALRRIVEQAQAQL